MKLGISNDEQLPPAVKQAFDELMAQITESFRVQHHHTGLHSFTAMPPEGRADVLAPVITSGSGAPEAIVAGNIGDLYLRTDGSTSTTLYVKTAGLAGTNTGWTAK